MNIKAYIDRLEKAAVKCGFTISYYGKVGDTGLPALERHHEDGAPEIYISTGVHGDEPAGPMALLALLQRGSFPAVANYTLFPMINPSGLEAGTRENIKGIDLNRDYGSSPKSHETGSQIKWIGNRQYGLTLCLHEDYDGEGFYLYAHAKEGDATDYAGLALGAAEPFTGIDGRTEIDEMPAKDGHMYPPEDVMDMARVDLPEALYLLFNQGAEVSVTTETPSCQPITSRIDAQCAAVETLVSAYLKSVLKD